MGSLWEQVGAEEEGLSRWSGSHRLAFKVITRIGCDPICPETIFETLPACQGAAGWAG
jgi:hypothetical protein